MAGYFGIIEGVPKRHGISRHFSKERRVIEKNEATQHDKIKKRR